MKKKNKKRDGIQPIMSYLILISIVIVLSAIFSLFDLQSTYYSISNVTGSSSPISVDIKSLLSISGIKHIFSNTVVNYATFTVLSNLIIILMGISMMEKTGFLKTAITMLTKKSKKSTVTFVFVLLCILSSIMGGISYLIFIPIGALLFLYGKRNPATGIICAFAALSCGSGINIFFNSVDSSLFSYTSLAATVVNKSFVASRTSLMLLMIVLTIILSFVITYITENITTKKVPKFDFDLTVEDDELIINNSHKRGMLFALFAAFIYLLIFIYSVVPGLPLSGILLDDSQIYYIDKLFSPNSFFNSGFVFIITILFIILGLFYGIGARTIKNQEDFCDYLSHSLDGIGRMLVMIFFASLLISVFKYTNIGELIASFFASIIGTSGFNGLTLIILLFILTAISTLFLPSFTDKWLIMSPTVVSTLMASGISPEFSQAIFTLASTSSLGITPLLSYFIVYFIFLEKYNQSDKKIKLKDAFKYQLSYTFIIMFLFLSILIIWYLINIPLSVGVFPTL